MPVRALHRLTSRHPWLVGSLLLAMTAWVCMYGKIWCFDTYDAHRFTARAMLTGTLRMRGTVTLAGHDEQVHHGAVYTNWGYGAPVLELPFHALAGALRICHGFFPDRAIYFVYLVAAMPLVWLGFDRLLRDVAPQVPETTRRLVSWATTWMVLQVTLFPLMEDRFVIFEVTLAYMAICEMLALAAYLHARSQDTWRPGHVALMGAASGMGLLVRPTALLYAGVWGALLAFEPRSRRVRSVLVFAAVCAPFLAFWLYTNWARTGSPLSLGYGNSNPAWTPEMPVLRFGSKCIDSGAHLAQAMVSLFSALFFCVRHPPRGTWLRDCFFDYEERDGTSEPFLGPAVLLLLVVVAWRFARRREWRLELWVPLAAIVVLLATFVRRGEGFAWRYEADVWTLIVLAAVGYVRTLPAAALRIDARTAKLFFSVGFVALCRYLVPWQWSSGGPHGEGRAEVLWPGQSAAAIEDEFRASRWGSDPPIPSHLACETRPHGLPYEDGTRDVPYDDGSGWGEGCSVSVVTNVYLGIPRKESNRYELRFHTEGLAAREVKVYLDGSYYTARRTGGDGDGPADFSVDVTLDARAFYSPVVVAAMQWTTAMTPPPARLLWIELR
jgi:hypothetical protein